MKTRLRISLRYKAAILIALTEVVLLGLLLATNLWRTRADLEEQLRVHANATAELVAASATETLLAYDLAQMQNLLRGVVGRHRVVYAEITDHRRRALAFAGDPVVEGMAVRIERPIRVHGTLFGSVRIVVSRAETEAALLAATHSNLAIAGIEIILVAVISLTLGWILTRNLSRLAQGAEAIGHGDLRARVPVTSSDELGVLAARFNAMAEQLEHSHHRFRDMADNTSDWLWETDDAGRYTYVSNRIEDLLGVAPGAALGQAAGAFMVAEDARRFERLLAASAGERRAFYDFEYRASRPDGGTVVLEANGSPIFAEPGRVSGFRGVTRDVTRRKQDESRLVYLAEHDALTGLYSRARFLELLEEEIGAMQRAGLPLAVLFVDLDDFRLINDIHGHVAGDALLKVVSELIAEAAGPGNPVARLGGDEFGILLRAGGRALAEQLARNVLETLSRAPLAAGETPVHLAASVGIAIFPEAGAAGEALLARADMALSHAKSIGHGSYHSFEVADREPESMRRSINWQVVLHEALGAGRFFLEYQPIARLHEDGKASFFEALVRLREATGTAHAAARFIETAEQTGLIAEIDKFVLREVVRRLRTPAHRGACIAVNLSGRSLGAPGFTEFVQELLVDSGIEPQRLLFEITETAAVAEMARARSFIGEVKKLGFRFALDDFGVGFSSFSYLKHLPVDMVKIDGSFVRYLDRSREDRLFVRAIVQVARELGLETVAEFVESREVLEILREIGVDYVQGYYLGRPGPTLEPQLVEGPRQRAYKIGGQAH
jgi:diguanylate cyclase (GGDEF)-like protein/PAS domain S-box-containing protein